MSSGDLEVSAFDVSRSKPVPNLCGPGCRPLPTHSLARPNTTNVGVFEGGQDPWHQCRGPCHIVIGHDRDRGLHLRECLTDLKPLVCNPRTENPNLGEVQSFHQSVQRRLFACGRDQNKLCRFASKDTHERRPQFLEGIVNRRDDYRHILARERWFQRNRFRFVRPMADAMYQ